MVDSEATTMLGISPEEAPPQASASYVASISLAEMNEKSSVPAAAEAAPSSGSRSSSARPFLRKGARMARSLPPDQRNKPARLQPREAFRQAAEMTTPSTASAAKPSVKQQRSRQITRARSLAQEASGAQPTTPQRSSARAPCTITPAALPGPLHRGDSRPGIALPSDTKAVEEQNSGCFTWRDPSPERGHDSQNEDLQPASVVRRTSAVGASRKLSASLRRSPGTKSSTSVETKATDSKAPASCAMCGATVGTGASKCLLDCAGCGLVKYCQRDCQLKDWPVHKAVCTAAIDDIGLVARPASPEMEVVESDEATRDLRMDFEDAKPAGVGGHLQLLDAQILQFRQDNEVLARLRKQAEVAEAQLARERDKLRLEVEEERVALRAEVERERQTIRRERRRLEQEAERKRREAASERLELREHIDELREELRKKERNWQRSVDRLQRQVDELSHKNRELAENMGESVSTSAPSRAASRPSSVSSQRRGGRISRGTSRQRNYAAEETDIDADIQRPQAQHSRPDDAIPQMLNLPAAERLAEVPPLPILAASPEGHVSDAAMNAAAAEPEAEAGPELPAWGSAPAAPEAQDDEDDGDTEALARDLLLNSDVVREVQGPDGRTQRLFEDGREEVVFPSGLRKVLWSDGRTSVFFQNGDVKESHLDGNVVYRYQSTGAVQTTQPNGTEIYEFAGGQVEWHHRDGSKEILFSNGAGKRISANGFEEVCPADSRGLWTPVGAASVEMDWWRRNVFNKET